VTNVSAFLNQLETALAEDETNDGIQTGFVDEAPDGGNSTYVFLNRQNFDYGHLLDDNGNPIRTPGRYIAGRVEEIEHFTRESEQYSDSSKLRLRVEADTETIMIETGFFSNTGKSLLSDLVAVQNPGSVLTIEPSLPDERRDGGSQNVLFTDLYEGSDLVISKRWPDSDQDVIDLFHEVREDVFGLPAQEEDQPHLPSGGGGRQQAPQQQPQQRRQGGGGAPPRQNGGGQQNGQRQQRQPQQNGQPQQGGRQPAAGNGQPQQAPQQGGGQQPNAAPPSRNDTAQTPSTPPPTTI
jgi:hypothetical protein